MSHAVPESYKACITVCQLCALECEICLQKMMGKNSHNDCPACCYECLELCLLCMRALARNSPYAKDYCTLCAAVCDWCQEQCSAHNMDHCRQCAESCRECAEECRKLAA